MLARRVVKPWGAGRGGASPGEPSPNQRGKSGEQWWPTVATTISGESLAGESEMKPGRHTHCWKQKIVGEAASTALI